MDVFFGSGLHIATVSTNDGWKRLPGNQDLLLSLKQAPLVNQEGKVAYRPKLELKMRDRREGAEMEELRV